MGLLLVALLGEIAYGANNEDLEVEIAIGYDNMVKIGDGNPVEVTLTNNGNDFSGEIQIYVKSQSQDITIYAKEFDLPGHSTKVIDMTIPLMTIQRKIDIKIVEGKKELFEDTIKVDGIFPPEATMIGVVADDPDQYRFLGNLDYLQNYNGEYIDYYPMYSSTMPTDDYEVDSLEPQAMFVEDLSEILTPERLTFFNYLFIGQVDEISITDQELENLLTWIEGGGVVVSESGNRFQKVNQILPDILKLVEMEQVEAIDMDEVYVGVPIGSEVNIAKPLIVPEDVNPLTFYDLPMGYYKSYGTGYVVELAMDFSTAPISTWNGKTFLFQDALSVIAGETAIDDYYYYEDYYQYNNYLNAIPVTKGAPYIVMIVVLIIYLLATGPILYFIMKKKDKRIHMWWLVPAMAVFSVLLFFIFGFSTRYTKPISNQLSVIHYEEGDQIATVETYMNILNNRKGDLSIEWSSKDGTAIETVINNYDYYYYNEGMTPTVKAKINQGATTKYTLFDTEVWTGNMVKASKMMDMDGGDMVTVTYDADDFIVEVNNNLPITLEYAFVSWGNYFIDLGTIAPGETVTKREPLSQTYFDNYYMFDEHRFGYMRYNNMQTYHEDLEDNAALREILNMRYGNDYYRAPGTDTDYSVKLVALNKDAVGYDLTVNGGDYDPFFTNIIEIVSEVTYESGSKMVFDEATIRPSAIFGYDDSFINTGYVDYNTYENIIYIYEKGVIELTYTMPVDIEMDSVSLSFKDILTMDQYYNKGASGSNDNQILPLSIYNNHTQTFEPFDESFESDEAVYMNDNNQIIVRIDTRQLSNRNNENYIEFVLPIPEFSVEGVVK